MTEQKNSNQSKYSESWKCQVEAEARENFKRRISGVGKLVEKQRTSSEDTTGQQLRDDSKTNKT